MLRIEHTRGIDVAVDVIKDQLADSYMYLKYIDAMKSVSIDHIVEQEIIEKTREFCGLEISTLKYSSKDYKNNPYIANIKLEPDEENDIIIEIADVASKQLHNMGTTRNSFILDSYIPVGYYDCNMQYSLLKYDKKSYFMEVTYSDIVINQPIIDKVKGNIATVGLGLGYYVYMCLLKEDVAHITVYESNKKLINYFNKVILPQFKGIDKDRLTIIHKENIIDVCDSTNVFDHVYFNLCSMIYGMNEHYIPLLENNVYRDNADFVIEDSLIYETRTLVALYIMKLYEGCTITEYMQGAMTQNSLIAKKINRYFKANDVYIQNGKQLVDFIHSTDKIRDILAFKIS